MQEYKSNREIQILRENLKILIKTTVIEMKKAFDGLLVEWTWLRKVSDLEDISTESSKTKKQREQRLIEQNRTFKDCGTPKKI